MEHAGPHIKKLMGGEMGGMGGMGGNVSGGIISAGGLKHRRAQILLYNIWFLIKLIKLVNFIIYNRNGNTSKATLPI